MPKYPVLTSQAIVKALERLGFRFVSQKGSHMKYSNGSRTTIVPNHREVRRGTLQSILSLAGVSLDEFLRNL